MTRLLYLLFLLSGAAALVYQVVWVRSLSLVFGGTHLAVTTVLATFMAGLAAGGVLLGRRADRLERPLRAYALLELGIAASALGGSLVLELYPAIYPALARIGGSSVPWLTAVRVVFAAAAIIVPTTLMGGTLPVLSRLLADRPGRLGRPLAWLYGVNTLGAVLGTLASAFVLLPALGVTRTTWIAVATNATVGLAALGLARRAPGVAAGPVERAPDAPGDVAALPARVVLAGIGISGFCALGYEVLWTRVLSLIVGTSVYSFAVMLVAFLGGIALGGQASTLVPRSVRRAVGGGGGAVLAFGAVQLAIGAAALGTTHALGRLPIHAAQLEQALDIADGAFAARQGASFGLAFLFMTVPAVFMGLAFPIAGAVHARRRDAVGGPVGEVLASNTAGAIVGAAASGFVLLPLLGIERSLHVLVLLNVGLGVVVLATLSPARRRAAVALAGLSVGLGIVALVAAPGWGRTWDREFLAVFRNNQRGAFDTPDRVREAIEHTDVLYYHEGIHETISVIRPRGGPQGFVVNGRVEASTLAEDVQCQRTLGHLPMLVHPDPRRVFVLGLGTGMTLGATSVHPGVERIVLAEIERGVLPAAARFGDFNHHVLDHPALAIVHDDGRNFLRTTRETFDVITADPIHPWSGGASYLYTAEYFRSAAEHLAPGGVICQWLPIYEMAPDDLRSVARTFASVFRHTAIWLTWYDAEMLGSSEPLVLDERRLAERMADPTIAADLAAVDMGTPRDLLSYFLLGDSGVRAFAVGGVIHTDDNLWLEFSTPRAQGRLELPARNVETLVAFRESPLASTAPLPDPAAEAERRAFWARAERAAALRDRAHVLGLRNLWTAPEMRAIAERLGREFPDYAPGRFLDERRRRAVESRPRPISSERFAVLGADGVPEEIEITAVTMRVGAGRGVVVFVDNAVREVYAERYVDAPDGELDARLAAVASRVLDGLRIEYVGSLAGGHTPARAAMVPRLKRAAASLAAG